MQRKRSIFWRRRPPEPQIVANTVGRLGNWQVFLPKAETINPEFNPLYQLVYGKYFFIIAFSDLRGIGRIEASIQAFRIDLPA